MLAYLLRLTLLTSTVDCDKYAAFIPLPIKRLVEVKISTGRLQGFETSVPSLHDNHENKTAYVFKRVPYAEPPIGANRFRRLRHKKPWNDVLNATVYGPTCLTRSLFTASRNYDISEDCIFANIFIGSKCFKGKIKCPVLFYIYSGAFVFGSPKELSEYEIVQRYAIDDIIFMTFGYRVGIFGFIDSHHAFPNIGFDDVIFALKWMNKEIKNFGGDKHQVTIAGFSSGAFISQMLLASPDVPVELFNRAIIGSCTGIFGPHANREHTEKILGHFNCLRKDDKDFDEVECLRKFDGIEILNGQAVHEVNMWQAQHRMQTSDQVPGFNIRQVLDNHLNPRSILVTTELYELTINELEGLCEEYSAFDYHTDVVYRACLQRYVPVHLRLIEEKNVINDSIEALERVYRKENVGNYRSELIHVLAYQLGLINTRKGGTTFSGSFTLKNHRLHADDMFFFVGFHNKGTELTPAEKLMNNYYPKIIKNFIKYGNPDKDWRPVDENGLGYFDLDFVVENNKIIKQPEFHNDVPNPGATKFWIYDEAKNEIMCKLSQMEKDTVQNFNDIIDINSLS